MEDHSQRAHLAGATAGTGLRLIRTAIAPGPPASSSSSPESPRGARLRAYAEWYAWALPNLGGDRSLAHAAAEAAIAVLGGGGDARAAAEAARSSATASATGRRVTMDRNVREQRAYAEAYSAAVAQAKAGPAAHGAAAAAVRRGSRGSSPVRGAGLAIRTVLPGAALAVSLTILSGRLAGLLAVAGYVIAVRIWRTDLEGWLRAVLISATAISCVGVHAVATTLIAYLTGR